MSGIHDLVKAKTAPLHERFERLLFFQRLRAQELPKVAIVSFLQCLAIIHVVLERKLSGNSQRQISTLFDSVTPKLPFLVADLGILNSATLPSITPAIRIALDYADQILGEIDPLNLIGPLYVLEGSQNGAFAFKHEYGHCLDISAEQLSYFGCYGTATAARWDAFLNGLGTLTLDDEQRTRIALSAVRCFESLEAICVAACESSPKELKFHAASINFEAGDHAIPQNPVEIDLALRAGKGAWEAFPYLEQRFGPRGKRFTNSDSCWLVALTRAPGQEAATKALNWLRTVLATRGIPSLILEAHLGIIQQEIALEFPEEIEMRARFDRFLSNREAERRQYFGTEGQSSLISVFSRRFEACSGLKVESVAELIASAWIDERSGVAGARPALHDWFIDSGRFSKDWIANVNQLFVELDRSQP